jgi:hypothetical protein
MNPMHTQRLNPLGYTKRLLICFGATATIMSAQAVILTNQSSIHRPTSRAPGIVASIPLSNIGAAFVNQRPLVKRGPVSVRPRISYSLVYGDGILSVPGEATKSASHSIATGVLFELGPRWSFDYSLSRTTYSSHRLEDVWAQNASLTGAISRDDWKFRFVQSYTSNTPTLVETGRQTHETTYATNIQASYELGNRSKLDFTAGRNARRANPEIRFPGSWTGSDWVNWSSSADVSYSLSSRVLAAVGISAGYDDISDSNDMTTIQPHISLSWSPTDKISMSVQRGIQRRKFEGDNKHYLTSPTYSASLNYTPFPTTTLTASATRNVTASYFADQVTRSTQWNLNAEQRLLKRYYFGATFSHGQTLYIPSGLQAFVPRNDNFDSYSFRLSTPILYRGTGSISYARSKNLSSDTGFTFKSHQFGLDLSYHF